MENDFSVDAFANFLPKFKVVDFPKFPKKRITSQSILKNFFPKSRQHSILLAEFLEFLVDGFG